MENNKTILPLTPKEILENRVIDGRIIEAVNSILKDKFIGEEISIKLKDIEARMKQMYGEDNIDFNDLYDKKQFDFEDVYLKYGWKVNYDKGAYYEIYDSFYTFKPIKNEK